VTEPELLLAGEAGRPHGVGGEVHVVRISDDPSRFEPGSRLVHSGGRELVVESARSHGNHLLVKFQDVNDRETAGSLKGALYVPTAEARTLEPGEFWAHQLIGCEVRTVAGAAVGRLSEVVPGTAQDLMRVATSGGERLIPMVEAIVVEVDTVARVVTIDPPEGLLD
jgi:16S rRNA processing protein RimM